MSYTENIEICILWRNDKEIFNEKKEAKILRII